MNSFFFENDIREIFSEDFSNCSNVFKVDFSAPGISSISGFCHLPKSIEIYIGPLWEEYINQSCFDDFSNLTEMILTLMTGTVTNMTFQPLRNLPIKRLKLESVYIQLMDEYVLSWFPRLISIDIEASIIYPFLEVPSFKAWDGLKHSKLLKKIRFSFITQIVDSRTVEWIPPVTIFNSRFSDSLACCPNVDELHLDGTNAIEAKDLCYELMNLSQNYFDRGNIYTEISHLSNCERLTALDLSNQINMGPRRNNDKFRLRVLPRNLAILDLSYISQKVIGDTKKFSIIVSYSWKQISWFPRKLNKRFK